MVSPLKLATWCGITFCGHLTSWKSQNSNRAALEELAMIQVQSKQLSSLCGSICQCLSVGFAQVKPPVCPTPGLHSCQIKAKANSHSEGNGLCGPAVAVVAGGCDCEVVCNDLSWLCRVFHPRLAQTPGLHIKICRSGKAQAILRLDHPQISNSLTGTHLSGTHTWVASKYGIGTGIHSFVQTMVQARL